MLFFLSTEKTDNWLWSNADLILRKLLFDKR